MLQRQGFLSRLLAGMVDLLLGVVAGLPFSQVIGRFFASRAVVMLRIGSSDTIWKGLIPLIIGIFGTFFYALPFSVLIVFLIEPFFQAGPGKLILRMRIGSWDGGTAALGARFLRSGVKTVGIWGLILSLLLGNWIFGVLSVVAGFISLLGFFLALSPSRLALHDRIAGTEVYRYPLSSR